jgi:methylated-DNA-[protein]-cysteine S-methyltransferase
VQAHPDAVLAEAVRQLRAYLDGQLTDFDLPLSVRRGEAFERAVWDEIARIPYAETRTYGEVATATGDGDPLAARAVGVACNRNPLPIVVPCHRVVGAGGKLVGFGGGLHRKRFLLELEAGVRIVRDFGVS